MLPLLALYLSAFVLAQEDAGLEGRRAPRPKAAADCVLSLSDPPPNVPLIANGSGTLYPRQSKANDEIIISGGKCATASCPSTTNQLQAYSTNQVDVCCDSSGLVINPTVEPTSFKQLGCSQPVKEDIGEVGPCYGGYSNVSIEFRNVDNRFPLITLCHDPESMNTLFAQHTIYGGSLSSAQISNARPSFKKAQFYGTVSPNTAYTQSSQKNMVASLVQSTSLANKYIDPSQSFYFARGHLAPDGDFVYVFEQNATYYFVNVVPQWQSINNGNWKAMEVAVRKQASSIGKLNVYTGGYGVLQLKDVNNNPVDIYLARDKNTQQLTIPVPRLTWKVVHSTVKQSAVAIVMVNNPHDLAVTSADMICRDICNQISWITWDIYDTRKGYTYCCDLPSFQAALPYAPKVRVISVLK